ncbi:MAG: hypothetical protein M3Y59_17115 [Myxococcota bacterium]|nr:hypothetical protein [Myxococcota bacterium]
MKNNKHLSLVGILAAVGLTACPGYTPFPQPENTVAVNFTIDASGRPGFYEDGDLEWKGSFTYDETSRILTYDSSWAGGAGPYPTLHDDGPWNEGGHEPLGAVAGDDKFGITAFIATPAEAITLEYGAQTCCGATGGWVWTGSNGSVEVTPTSTGPITAEGLTLSPEGTVDLRLTLNTNALGSGHVLATPVKVKGTFSDWAEEQAYDDGTHGDATSADGIYTYTLSENATRRLKLTSGTTAQFIWVLNTQEYKTSGSAGEQTGVMAYTKGASDSAFVARTVILFGTDENTAVAIP